MQAISMDLFDYQIDDQGGRITKEFQDYGYRLALELNDEKSKALYIKLAKTVDRPLMEKARTFVKDANNVKHKGKLFMWVLGKIRRGEPLYDDKTSKF